MVGTIEEVLEQAQKMKCMIQLIDRYSRTVASE